MIASGGAVSLQIRQPTRILEYHMKILRRLYAMALGRAFGTITQVATQERVAALTFDDGPHPEFTPRLLEILERHGAHATFFMLGEAARKHPAVVQQVARGGHAIGNHSWDHPSFPLITGRARCAQMRACAAAVAPYGGRRLFRPPYGHQNIASRLEALWLGYRVVTWNVVAEDWCDRDVDWMANRLVERIKPGSVVLLHDAIYWSPHEVSPQCDRGPMLAAVDTTLGRLGGRFRFVTIPELLRYGRPRRQYWYRGAEPELLPLLNKHPLVARKSAAHSGHTK
jgi:peptidoglycan/xylan/chitin deacetylase (PgdA/CDA1 family)